MDLQRAKELLSGLADGVDPLTGEVLPEDHVCNKAEIIRAFHCVLKALPGKPPKPQPENAGKPWNDADDAVLCQMFDAGGSRKEMCAYFKRSEGSLAARLVRLGKISCDVTRSVSKMTEIERRGGKRWDKPKKAEKSRDCGGGKF